MKKICINSIKRKIYKKIPINIRSKLVKYMLPSIKLDLDYIEFRSAKTQEEYIQAFHLLHNVYVNAGYADPSAVPLRFCSHHSHPDSRVFLGRYTEGIKKFVIYTISTFPDTDDGLPMDIVFKNELDKLRSKGRYIVEAGCLASYPLFRKNDMNIPMIGNKMIIQYALQNLDADDIVISIHPKHQWLYEDLILFEAISDVKSYSAVKGNPAIAMRLDLRALEQNHKKKFASMPISKNFHHFFFEGQSNSIVLPENKSTEDKNFIAEHVFNSIAPEFIGCSSSLK